jgi:hypothetical protein
MMREDPAAEEEEEEEEEEEAHIMSSISHFGQTVVVCLVWSSKRKPKGYSDDQTRRTGEKIFEQSSGPSSHMSYTHPYSRLSPHLDS